jgi:hypothetical protein
VRYLTAALAVLLMSGTALAQTPGSGGVSSSGTGCVPAGSSGSILTDDGAGACTSNTTGTGVLGALAINIGSAGAPVVLGGAGGTPSALNLANATNLPNASVNGLGTAALAATGTSGHALPYLDGANTISALQTYNNSMFKLLGSSTGGTTFTSSNAGASNFTLTFPGVTSTVATVGTVQTYTLSQRFGYQTPTIATATFTPAVASGNNIRIGLTSACPCTLANFSGSLVAGQRGVIEVAQDGTGSRTIGTWGAEYEYVGGTSTITLSTAAGAVDYISYEVDSTASFIVLSPIRLNPIH